MAMDIERVHYYERQYLGVAAFIAEEAYHRGMRRRHNLGPHIWGTVVGLELTQLPVLGSANAYDVYLQPGMAVDGFGREIFVLAPQQLDPADFQRFTTPGFYDVWIEYREQLVQPPAAGYQLCDAQNQFARVAESFHIVTGTQRTEHDQVTVDGKLVGPPRPPKPGDPPLPPDDSVPFQEFPDDSALPRWLIHLGRVNWDAANQQFLQSDATNLALNRSYIASVAASVLAPTGQLRLAARNSPSPLGATDAGVSATVAGSLEVNRKFTADKDALISGELEVQGLVNADADLYVGGKLGVGTKTPRNRLGVRGSGVNEELVSFEDAAGATKWHLNQKVNPTNPGLNFAETNVADGRLYLEAGGNVGIGTLSPSNRFHVNDATGIRQNRLYMSGGNGWSSLSYNAYHDAANANWVFPDKTRPALTIEMDDNGGSPRFQVFSTSAAATTAWQLRLAIEGDTGRTSLVPGGGRVGIGTGAPQASVHIRSDEPHMRLEATSNRAVIQIDKGGLQWDFGVGTGAGNNDFWIGDFNEYRLVLQKNSKNIGIGTQTPKNPLGIRARGGSEDLLSFESPNGVTRWEINQNGGTTRGLNLVDTGVGAGARLFIAEGSGNVGIGTSNPLARLQVIGEIRATVKNFMIDHPLDPQRKYLVHSSLEGPEVAVFYRGEGRLSGGQATITLPNYFEALTRRDGRTVLLTPKYENDLPVSMLAASAIDSGRFSVRHIGDGNPNQPFYWEVKAVRIHTGELEVEPNKEATQ